MTKAKEIQVGGTSPTKSVEQPCVNAANYLTDWHQNITKDFCENLNSLATENRAFVIKDIISPDTKPLWFHYVRCLFKPNEEEQTQQKIDFLTEKKWGIHKLYDLIDFVCTQVSAFFNILRDNIT